MADEEDVKEGPDFQPTGTIHLWVDGKRIRIRHPNGRQFKRMRASFLELLDASEKVAQEHQTWLTDLQAKGDEREKAGEDRWTPAERQENQTRGQAMNDRLGELNRDWVLEVIVELAVNPVEVDPDDAPMWMHHQSVAAGIMQHWQTVPLPSGAH